MNDGDSNHGDCLGPATVVADTAQLRPGIRLKKPLYDAAGTLLLDAGQTVTETVKKMLLARGIERVLLSPDDADALLADRPGLRQAASRPTSCPIAPLTSVNNEAAADIASLVRRTGVPLKDHLIPRSNQPYDPEFTEQLVATFKTATKHVEALLRRALQGRPGHANVLADVVRGCINQMANDIDQVVGSSIDTGSAKPLVQRSLRMALLGMAVGIEMGLDTARTCDVGLCALVQDWGMFRLPERLWNPSEPFRAQDWELYLRHPEFTGELLEQMSALPPAVKIAATQVHELCDGSGYPRGLTQNRIHSYARILAPVDAYLCLVETRRGRPAIVPHDALACLLHQLPAGHFDPKVLQALLAAISLFPLGSYVRLSDGRAAQVIRRNASDYSKPVVQCLRMDRSHRHGDKVLAPTIVDLSKSLLQVVDVVAASGKNEMRLDRSLMHDIVWDGPES